MTGKQLIDHLQSLDNWETLEVFISLNLDDPRLTKATSIGTVSDFGVEITA